jgi:hypothetical protein
MQDKVHDRDAVKYHLQILFEDESGKAWTDSFVGNMNTVVESATNSLILNGMNRFRRFHMEEIKEQKR